MDARETSGEGWMWVQGSICPVYRSDGRVPSRPDTDLMAGFHLPWIQIWWQGSISSRYRSSCPCCAPRVPTLHYSIEADSNLLFSSCNYALGSSTAAAHPPTIMYTSNTKIVVVGKSSSRGWETNHQTCDTSGLRLSLPYCQRVPGERMFKHYSY